MTGLDWRKAPIGLREALSFTRSRVVELDRLLRAAEGVEGCVLLSTCNRTELYLSCAAGAEPEPGALLCAAAAGVLPIAAVIAASGALLLCITAVLSRMRGYARFDEVTAAPAAPSQKEVLS